MGEDSLIRFQNLLRTLFQFDYADLDFGIYRILNYKRKQIEAFIIERLPKTVEEAFGKYAAAEMKEAEQEVERLRDETKRTFGIEAVGEQGQLKFVFHDTPLGKEYLRALERAKSVEVAEELRSRVYNDLYTFFSRYYEEGDFVSKRRYGRNETYVIPYNGEEVVLHWANRDQYYIKTGENFKTYRFKVGDYTMAFQLRDVSIEQSNQNKNRYFILVDKEPIDWNAGSKALTMFLEYRSLMEAEEKEHGKTEQQRPQDKLNELTEKQILELVVDTDLKVALAKIEKRNGREKSVLRWRLDHFTRRNTTDFFIHKDLRGFLRRELDFFIKNEVLQLDELVGGKETDLQRHVQRGRVVRDIAEGIIDFLAQVEDFQKTLFEKKKFVVSTEYCLTIDRVPEEFWEEILANKPQIAEWQQLYSLDKLPKSTSSKKSKRDFLKTHPTLVIDTQHFSDDFKWHLLAGFDDLDEALDGTLIRSENWQALNSLLERYHEQTKCIYIDPPYNTGNDEFLYRDNYQHSSWLSMMIDRLAVARHYLLDNGVLCMSIDNRELPRARLLMERVMLPNNEIAQVTVRVKDPAGVGQQSILFDICEYVLVFAKDVGKSRSYHEVYPVFDLIEVKEPPSGYRHLIRQYGNMKLVSEITRSGVGSVKIFKCSGYKIEKAEDLSWEEYVRNAPNIYADYNPSGGMILAIRDQLPEKGLSCIQYTPIRGKSAGQMATVYFLDRRILASAADIFQISDRGVFRRSATSNLWSVSNASLHMEGGVKLTEGKKPEALLHKIIQSFTQPKQLILDFFLGSGTSCAVAHKTGRSWIGVEVDDELFQLALTRLKLTLTGEKTGISKEVKWKGGGFFEYQNLEQYEDTLNNLELIREGEGQKMMELFGDEYFLRYMLDFETQGSSSLLNVDIFKEPFSYKLKIREKDEIHERTIDLVETFNYLLGLNVKRMMAFQDKGRFYQAVLGDKNGSRIVVIWRTVTGLENNEEALMRDRSYIEQTILPALLGEAKPDRLLINGISFVEEAEAIEPEFKRLMFGGVA